MRNNLSGEQKEVVVLMSIGTFLEYFDLMLFVHMSVILNELFFPKTDPFTASLLSAFAFCSTFIFKPLGALLFGYIGDKVGRKHTVIITTMIMAISCLIMANVGTYAQIGITASWVITICRALQGMSSIGETVGAELYALETIRRPYQYPAVGLIGLAGVVGMTASLIVAKVVIGLGITWRAVFWIGALIAIIGFAARTMLRESPEFSDAKRKMDKAIKNSIEDGLDAHAQLLKATNLLLDEKVNIKTSVYYFLIFCGWPFCFYFSYVYCGGILKDQFHYSSADLINHNLIISISNLVALYICVMLTKKFHPLKIQKIKVLLYLPFLLTVPYILQNTQSVWSVFIIQFCGVALGNSTIPAKAIFLTHFPVFKRFRYASFLTAISHVVLYLTTSFGLVFLVKFFGYYAILLISIPTTLAFLAGTLYFINLDKQAGFY
jgi:MHS family proline/betaine transporter-like MFS transporter